MKIHFICRMNIYRSRIAEAYTKSRLSGRVNVEVSSSGVEAEKYQSANIAPIAADILHEHGLELYISDTQQQTTQELLDQMDIVIFLNDDVYTDARKLFEISDADIHVWHISDLPGVESKILRNVDELISKMSDKPY